MVEYCFLLFDITRHSMGIFIIFANLFIAYFRMRFERALEWFSDDKKSHEL